MIFKECWVPLLCISLAVLQSFKLVDSKSVVTTIMPSKPEDDNSTTTHSSIKNDSNPMEIITTKKPSVLDAKSIIETKGGSTKTNSTSSNYIAEYKPLVFDSPEDIKTQQEWGGNCTLKHWDQCKVLAKWFGKYEDPKDGEIKEYFIDCKEEPVVCLTNSWTVTRCNLLCMSRCNREIQYKYDKYVSHDGECKAHAHG